MEVVLEASSYIRAVWPALAAGLLAATIYGYGTALGKGKRLLAISTGVTLASIPLTGLLAFPWGLGLGIEGVGHAAVISSATLAVCFGLAIRDDFPDFRSAPKVRAAFAGKMMKLGLPFGLIFLSEMSFLYIVMLLMGTMGEDELAAHAVVIQWVTLLLVFPVGFSQAARSSSAARSANRTSKRLDARARPPPPSPQSWRFRPPACFCFLSKWPASS